MASAPIAAKAWTTKNPEGALPFGTQLAGKYTIGKYLSADGDGLSYRGVNNEEKRFVRIKEYFPVTLCNGRSADGALMPKAGREVLFKTSRMDFKDLYDDLYRLTPATGAFPHCGRDRGEQHRLRRGGKREGHDADALPVAEIPAADPPPRPAPCCSR